MESAACEGAIERNKVGAILSLGCDVRLAPGFSGWEGTAHYLALPDVHDRPEDNLIRLWPEALAFMAAGEPTRNVVVHCVYGQSRSAATIVAYLTSFMNMGLDTALSFLKERCPRICINPGFLSQLHLWVNRWRFRAEFQLLCPNGTYLEHDHNDEQVRLPTGDTSCVVYMLKCRSCSQGLFHIASDRGLDASSHVALESMGLCDMTRALLDQPREVWGPASHDVDDLRSAVLLPRPGAKEIIDRHLDPYYRGYTSPYQYERPSAAVLSFPLLLARGQSRGKMREDRETMREKKRVSGAEERAEREPTMCLAAVPGSWVDTQCGAALHSESVSDLHCPSSSCSAIIGCCKKDGLRICDGYIKTHLVGLFAKAVRWEASC